MTKVLNTISAIGALVMAATPLLAIPAFAHAQDMNVQPQRIQLADLDMSSPADVARFNIRADAAAARMCAGQGDLTMVAACRQAVRQEAVEKLGAVAPQTAQVSSGSWTVAGR